MYDLEQTETPEQLTWEALVELEPRLEGLLGRVLAARPIRRRGANYEGIWGRFKDPLSDLVGYFLPSSRDPRLRSTEAYDVAYKKLYDALHDSGPHSRAP